MYEFGKSTVSDVLYGEAEKLRSSRGLASIFTLAVTVNSCIRADVGRISPHVALLAVQNAGGRAQLLIETPLLNSCSSFYCIAFYKRGQIVLGENY